MFVETAINIGYSCKLLTDEMEDMFVVDGDTYATVEQQLNDAREEMRKVESGERDPVEVTYGNGHMNGGGNMAEDAVEEERGIFALVVNGHSLVSVCQVADLHL